MNKALQKQNPPNKNMFPWNPSTSMSSGKHFIVVNAQIHNSDIQNDTPKSFRFSGITSEITKNGSVKTAHEAMKMTNEKLATGSQFKNSTS